MSDLDLIRRFVDAIRTSVDSADVLLTGYPELRNARWIQGETLLHYFAARAEIDAIRYLVSRDADLEAENDAGHTALMEAVVLGNAQTVRILLECGADANTVSAALDAPLHQAVSRGQGEIVDLLLAHGANPTYETDLGETIFDALAAGGDVQSIKDVLRNHGIELED